MEALYFLILLPVVAFFLYIFYLRYRSRYIATPRPLLYRMLVAVRRRPAGLGRFLGMSPQEQITHLNNLDAEWQALNSAWQGIGQFNNGFGTAERGLPATGDEEWKLFAFYDLPDFASYGQCVAALEAPQFRLLRNSCEIRFIFGTTLASMNQTVSRLF